MSTVEEVTSTVEVYIDEVSRDMIEFLGDSSTRHDDEVLRDITTLDEELIGTKAPISTIELQGYSHLQHGDNIEGCDLVMLGKFMTHIEPMVEEDE